MPCREGFYIMDCIPEGSIPPPPIIEAACFMRSGLFNIYCIIGLFIMSPIPSIEGMLAGTFNYCGGTFCSS